MPHPDARPPQDPGAHTRGLFAAVLEHWAGDCLRLRAAGLDRPSWRTRVAGPGRPMGVREGARPRAVPAPWAA